MLFTVVGQGITASKWQQQNCLANRLPHPSFHHHLDPTVDDSQFGAILHARPVADQNIGLGDTVD